MQEFDKIYLSWRKGQGSRRFIIGLIERKADGVFAFKYIQDQALAAKEDGFVAYTEFPELDKEYSGNVLDIFAQRLTKSVRPDVQSFYDFWEIEPEEVDDKFYLLGHTQGLLPTDNFEFLADYCPVDGLHFLTDLAGLSILKLPADRISVGDTLIARIEQNNEFDSEAVEVLKDDQRVGYIKKIHCRVFWKPGAEKLRLKVKALDKNGIVKRVFVKVYTES